MFRDASPTKALAAMNSESLLQVYIPIFQFRQENDVREYQRLANIPNCTYNICERTKAFGQA